MTFEDYQVKLKRKTSFSRYWYYTISVLVIILAIFMASGLTTHIDKFGWGHVFLYGIVVFFLSLGISGFYLIPTRYKIVIVNSNLDLERKQLVVEKLLNEYNITADFKDDQYVYFTIRTGFFKTPYTIHLFYDEERFAFSLQVRDYSDGGFMDFGGSETKRKEIENKIRKFSDQP